MIGEHLLTNFGWKTAEVVTEIRDRRAFWDVY
jgi:hypothetical protein